MKNRTDEELCAVWRDEPRRRADVMTEFYQRHAQRLHAYCRSMCDAHDDADDLFQESWLKFHAAMTKEPIIVTHVGAFLVRIARNRALNDLRTSDRTVPLEGFDVAADERRTDVDESQALLQAALRLLPADQRDVFILHDVQGMSYDEMSRVTTEPTAVLRTRLWRARTALREILLPRLQELRETWSPQQPIVVRTGKDTTDE